MTNLIIQSFGQEHEYRRAILTILSYYAHTKLSLDNTRVILFTDRPDYFSQYLEGLPVDYVLLTAEKIREMRGRIDFLHRMKISLIEEAFSMIDGNMLYADSDTFFTADPTPLMEQLTPQKCFMHLLEYEFESMRSLPLPAGKTFRDFLELIEHNTFKLTNGKNITITPQHVSWNAGVMMFHPTHAQYIPDVYALTDQFYPPTQNHACEQYAFSIILQAKAKVQPCEDVIYHYWYRVKKQIIDMYLYASMNDRWKKMPLSGKLVVVKKWSALLPSYFDNHILTIRDNAIQALNENNYFNGYLHTFKAMTKDPFNMKFITDVLYHTKRFLSESGK